MTEKFLDQAGLERFTYNLDQKLSAYVPQNLTINGKPLSDDIELTAEDLSLATMEQLNNAVRINIRKKWRDGWPAVWAQPKADTGRANIASVS